MADTHLLVPMQLDAMVLNTEANVATPFLRFEMDYGKLNSFESPEPAPFAGAKKTPPGAGIYLHWTLPAALRHGDHDDRTTTFPFIPNRWLVTRIQQGVAATDAIKAWLIESDYIHPDGSPPTVGAAFVDPAGPDADGTITHVRIGRTTLLTDVEAQAPQPAPFLTAVGAASAYFTAYEPGLADVLAFCDPVTANDGTPIAKATFAYVVGGWYSDPAHDPLAGSHWSVDAGADSPDRFGNSELPWHVYAGDDALPTQMLVHAVSHGVTWDRDAENPPPPNYPTEIGTNVRVAVGHTAIDALAAIVRLDKGSQTEADLLEAFQYGLLDSFDRPGSSEALSAAIRQHWYGASSGGTLWALVAAERADGPSVPVSPPPPPSAAQVAALAALNKEQRELDRQQRILESMQSSLFELWWMTQWQNENNPPVDGDQIAWLSGQLPLQIGDGSSASDPNKTDPRAEPWYAWKVNAQMNLVNELAALVRSDAFALTGCAAPEDPRHQPIAGTDLVLTATNMPQYFASQDPVVVVTGLGRATNFDPGAGALCRLSSNAVTVLTVDGAQYTAASLAGRIPALSDPRSLLPDGIDDLIAECVFLSPALFAEAVLGDAGRAPAVAKAIDALPAAANGKRFAPTAYSFAEWRQPWVPLLLDWQIVVLRDPAYHAPTGGATCTFDQSAWTFDGTDYRWSGPTTADNGNFDPVGSAQMTLTGRTFVTPHLVTSLAAQLDKYVKNHAVRDPGLEALLQQLDAYVGGVAGQDVLSQRLSGMLGRMAGRGQTQTVAPSGPIAALLGVGQHGVPAPFPDSHAGYADAVWDFAPLGGTFYVITGLTVIDAFGRTIDLLLSNHSTNPPTDREHAADYFSPIEGRDVLAPTAKPPAPGQGPSADATARMVQLPPAPVQPAQLRFRLLANDGSDADIDELPGANPVCGWIVPNHLDRGLSVYAPDGSAWGELSLSAHGDGTYRPHWQPDPTNPAAPTGISAIGNRFTRGLLTALWNQPDNGAACADFLAAIDETLWTINPRGDKSDHDLAVLVGRPLAIVRAELSLQLHGLALTSPDWWNLFTPDPTDPTDPTKPARLATFDGDISSFRWPIRLGSTVRHDDGLVGYFVDDPTAPFGTCTSFDAVQLPATATTGFVRAIGGATYPTIAFVDDSVTNRDPAQHQVCRLTMLVDPRGTVNAWSGLLPVVTLPIPSRFVTPALDTISYLFRAGPLLTVPDVVRIPRPAETKGTWTWFDHVSEAVRPLAPADSKVSIAPTSALIREGWLKFTPNPPTTP